VSDPIYTEIAKAYADAAKVSVGLKARFDSAGFDPARSHHWQRSPACQ